jgi:hypothetical protein
VLALASLAAALLVLLHTVATSLFSISRMSGFDFLIIASVLMFTGAKLGTSINSRIPD